MAFLGFGNTIWLWALLSLIPFILIYLIRPKPKEMDIPSLMFFIKSGHTEKERSFLRRFISDLLFFLQLLILILLSINLASPYLNIKQTVLLENSVIVFDNSASMQADNGKYFSKAIDIAKDNLGGRNTIILVSNTPKLALKDADKDDAVKFFESLEPSDSRSNIGDAVSFAGDYATGKDPVVFVISDFISTEGTKIEVAKNTLKNKGIDVKLIDVREEGTKKNIGIVDINPSDESTQIFIKNFNNNPETVNLQINKLEKEIEIQPNSIEVLSVKTPDGVTEINILNNDDLLVDNLAYISKPADEKVKVLLISNEESIYLKAALTASSDIVLETAKPPILPDKNYDVYIVQGVSKKNLITGFFEKLKDRIANGASLVIHAQIDSNEIDYKGLLPIKLGKKGSFANIIAEQINRFTREIEFGSVRNFFHTSDEEGVSIAKLDESSIIVLNKLGNGKVLFYGILEDSSDFKLSPSFPVFWVNLVKFLAEVSEIKDLNLRTGQILTFDNKINVNTPNKLVTGNILTLDKIGIYKIKNKNIAANLISEEESNINFVNKGSEIKDKNGSEESRIKQDITTLILIIAAILLFIELFWSKIRGDI